MKKMLVVCFVLLVAASMSSAAVINISSYLVDPTFDGYTYSGDTYKQVPATGNLQGWYASSNCNLDYQLENALNRTGQTAGEADSGDSFMRIYMSATASTNTWFRTSSAVVSMTAGNTYVMSFNVRAESAYAMVGQIFVQLPELSSGQMYYLDTDYTSSTEWQTLTFSYDCTSDISSSIRIFTYRTGTSAAAVNIDTIGSVIPEPTTMVLLGLGAFGFFRKKK